MFIIKKDGREEKWDPHKIFNAVEKSAERVNTELSKEFYNSLSSTVYSKLKDKTDVKNLHKIVENSLQDLGECKVADSYRSFRNYKTSFVDMMAEIYSKANMALRYGDRENANFESTLISTKQALIRGYLTKELYKSNYLTQEELEAIDTGYIYIHDLRDLIFNGFNCCLFDMANVLEKGFEMANLKYKEPTNVLSCLQVIGDVTLSASAQQFGGFTIDNIDKILVKYIKKSIVRYGKEAVKYGVSDPYLYAINKTTDDLDQGFQSLEMKLNSVTSSRGDYSFVTLTFGNLDVPEDREYQLMVCKAILKNRMKDNPVVFPKLVHLFSWEQYENVPEAKELFDLSIDCSCKALYPDYLAIDTVGKVSEYYKKGKKVVSPMGEQYKVA
jgi:ribonucleoside-triphosphate reductase